ncbi:hypothetical protein ACVIGA_003135 [Bradyrhizobium sp. USDA 3240]
MCLGVPFVSLTHGWWSSHADWWQFALAGAIRPAWRSVSAAFATASPLATGNWDSGNTAFTMHTLLCALHRAAAPDFETFPGMLWSRSSFEVSVVSDTGEPGKQEP